MVVGLLSNYFPTSLRADYTIGDNVARLQSLVVEVIRL